MMTKFCANHVPSKEIYLAFTKSNMQSSLNYKIVTEKAEANFDNYFYFCLCHASLVTKSSAPCLWIITTASAKVEIKI